MEGQFYYDYLPEITSLSDEKLYSNMLLDNNIKRNGKNHVLSRNVSDFDLTRDSSLYDLTGCMSSILTAEEFYQRIFQSQDSIEKEDVYHKSTQNDQSCDVSSFDTTLETPCDFSNNSQRGKSYDNYKDRTSIGTASKEYTESYIYQLVINSYINYVLITACKTAAYKQTENYTDDLINGDEIQTNQQIKNNQVCNISCYANSDISEDSDPTERSATYYLTHFYKSSEHKFVSDTSSCDRTPESNRESEVCPIKVFLSERKQGSTQTTYLPKEDIHTFTRSDFIDNTSSCDSTPESKYQEASVRESHFPSSKTKPCSSKIAYNYLTDDFHDISTIDDQSCDVTIDEQSCDMSLNDSTPRIVSESLKRPVKRFVADEVLVASLAESNDNYKKEIKTRCIATKEYTEFFIHRLIINSYINYVLITACKTVAHKQTENYTVDLINEDKIHKYEKIKNDQVSNTIRYVNGDLCKDSVPTEMSATYLTCFYKSSEDEFVSDTSPCDCAPESKRESEVRRPIKVFLSEQKQESQQTTYLHTFARNDFIDNTSSCDITPDSNYRETSVRESHFPSSKTKPCSSKIAYNYLTYDFHHKSTRNDQSCDVSLNDNTPRIVSESLKRPVKRFLSDGEELALVTPLAELNDNSKKDIKTTCIATKEHAKSFIYRVIINSYINYILITACKTAAFKQTENYSYDLINEDEIHRNERIINDQICSTICYANGDLCNDRVPTEISATYLTDIYKSSADEIEGDTCLSDHTPENNIKSIVRPIKVFLSERKQESQQTITPPIDENIHTFARNDFIDKMSFDGTLENNRNPGVRITHLLLSERKPCTLKTAYSSLTDDFHHKSTIDDQSCYVSSDDSTPRIVGQSLKQPVKIFLSDGEHLTLVTPLVESNNYKKETKSRRIESKERTESFVHRLIINSYINYILTSACKTAAYKQTEHYIDDLIEEDEIHTYEQIKNDQICSTTDYSNEIFCKDSVSTEMSATYLTDFYKSPKDEFLGDTSSCDPTPGSNRESGVCPISVFLSESKKRSPSATYLPVAEDVYSFARNDFMYNTSSCDSTPESHFILSERKPYSLKNTYNSATDFDHKSTVNDQDCDVSLSDNTSLVNESFKRPIKSFLSDGEQLSLVTHCDVMNAFPLVESNGNDKGESCKSVENEALVVDCQPTEVHQWTVGNTIKKQTPDVESEDCVESKEYLLAKNHRNKIVKFQKEKAQATPKRQPGFTSKQQRLSKLNVKQRKKKMAEPDKQKAGTISKFHTDGQSNGITTHRQSHDTCTSFQSEPKAWYNSLLSTDYSKCVNNKQIDINADMLSDDNQKQHPHQINPINVKDKMSVSNEKPKKLQDETTQQAKFSTPRKLFYTLCGCGANNLTKTQSYTYDDYLLSFDSASFIARESEKETKRLIFEKQIDKTLEILNQGSEDYVELKEHLLVQNQRNKVIKWKSEKQNSQIASNGQPTNAINTFVSKRKQESPQTRSLPDDEDIHTVSRNTSSCDSTSESNSNRDPNVLASNCPLSKRKQCSLKSIYNSFTDDFHHKSTIDGCDVSSNDSTPSRIRESLKRPVKRFLSDGEQLALVAPPLESNDNNKKESKSRHTASKELTESFIHRLMVKLYIKQVLIKACANAANHQIEIYTNNFLDEDDKNRISQQTRTGNKILQICNTKQFVDGDYYHSLPTGVHIYKSSGDELVSDTSSCDSTAEDNNEAQQHPIKIFLSEQKQRPLITVSVIDAEDIHVCDSTPDCKSAEVSPTKMLSFERKQRSLEIISVTDDEDIPIYDVGDDTTSCDSTPACNRAYVRPTKMFLSEQKREDSKRAYISLNDHEDVNKLSTDDFLEEAFSDGNLIHAAPLPDTTHDNVRDVKPAKHSYNSITDDKDIENLTPDKLVNEKSSSDSTPENIRKSDVGPVKRFLFKPKQRTLETALYSAVEKREDREVLDDISSSSCSSFDSIKYSLVRPSSIFLSDRRRRISETAKIGDNPSETEEFTDDISSPDLRTIKDPITRSTKIFLSERKQRTSEIGFNFITKLRTVDIMKDNQSWHNRHNFSKTYVDDDIHTTTENDSFDDTSSSETSSSQAPEIIRGSNMYPAKIYLSERKQQSMQTTYNCLADNKYPSNHLYHDHDESSYHRKPEKIKQSSKHTSKIFSSERQHQKVKSAYKFHNKLHMMKDSKSAKNEQPEVNTDYRNSNYTKAVTKFTSTGLNCKLSTATKMQKLAQRKRCCVLCDSTNCECPRLRTQSSVFDWISQCPRNSNADTDDISRLVDGASYNVVKGSIYTTMNVSSEMQSKQEPRECKPDSIIDVNHHESSNYIQWQGAFCKSVKNEALTVNFQPTKTHQGGLRIAAKKPTLDVLSQGSEGFVKSKEHSLVKNHRNKIIKLKSLSSQKEKPQTTSMLQPGAASKQLQLSKRNLNHSKKKNKAGPDTQKTGRAYKYDPDSQSESEDSVESKKHSLVKNQRIKIFKLKSLSSEKEKTRIISKGQPGTGSKQLKLYKITLNHRRTKIKTGPHNQKPRTLSKFQTDSESESEDFIESKEHSLIKNHRNKIKSLSTEKEKSRITSKEQPVTVSNQLQLSKHNLNHRKKEIKAGPCKQKPIATSKFHTNGQRKMQDSVESKEHPVVKNHRTKIIKFQSLLSEKGKPRTTSKGQPGTVSKQLKLSKLNMNHRKKKIKADPHKQKPDTTSKLRKDGQSAEQVNHRRSTETNFISAREPKAWYNSLLSNDNSQYANNKQVKVYADILHGENHKHVNGERSVPVEKPKKLQEKTTFQDKFSAPRKLVYTLCGCANSLLNKQSSTCTYDDHILSFDRTFIIAKETELGKNPLVSEKQHVKTLDILSHGSEGHVVSDQNRRNKIIKYKSEKQTHKTASNKQAANVTKNLELPKLNPIQRQPNETLEEIIMVDDNTCVNSITDITTREFKTENEIYVSSSHQHKPLSTYEYEYAKKNEAADGYDSKCHSHFSIQNRAAANINNDTQSEAVSQSVTHADNYSHENKEGDSGDIVYNIQSPDSSSGSARTSKFGKVGSHKSVINTRTGNVDDEEKDRQGMGNAHDDLDYSTQSSDRSSRSIRTSKDAEVISHQFVTNTSTSSIENEEGDRHVGNDHDHQDYKIQSSDTFSRSISKSKVGELLSHQPVRNAGNSCDFKGCKISVSENETSDKQEGNHESNLAYVTSKGQRKRQTDKATSIATWPWHVAGLGIILVGLYFLVREGKPCIRDHDTENEVKQAVLYLPVMKINL